MKKFNQISILLVACLATSMTSYAQFKINGKSVVYDKSSNSYMTSISEKAFGKDYAAVITLDTDSAWNNLSIENTKIENSFVFKDIKGNKEYTLKAQKGQQDINSKITFTFLPIIDFKGTFDYNYSNGKLSL